jgi:AAA family ATP:ADP antiporter
VSKTTVIRLAMVTAACMLGHQVASKAFRDAAFLTAWPATMLPFMVIMTAAAVVTAVPIFARLLSWFGPRSVVSAGFLLSAAGHLFEWQQSSGRPWVAVAIYLHVAGLGALLLSGYWSLVSERFDPRGARESFGRIAAAGTFGGALGGLAADRLAMSMSANSVLLMLAALHILCAAGTLVLGRAPVLLPATDAAPSERMFAFQALKTSPHLRTIALMVLLTTAGAGVLDFLLKWHVTQAMGTGPYLLRFFAIFYTVVQIVSFVAQAGSSTAIQQLGIGKTISTLPAGVALTSTVALLFPIWPVLVVVRGIEAVIRGSLFRSGYELLFVPMDVAERRQMKTFLDVTCDRAGDALGAIIVQLLLLTSLAFFGAELIAVVIVLAGAAWWIGRGLDRLYLDVVVQQLVKHADADMTPVVVPSETGWTVVELAPATPAEAAPSPKPAGLARPRHQDPRMEIMAELRSGDRKRVETALDRLGDPDRMHVAQAIELLAWDDLVASARRLVERVAASHVGLLIDALLDPNTDFAVRRRVPRILCTIASDRSLDGLVRGLDDTRFEVRYQCGRAIDRILLRDPSLAVDAGRIMSVVERELSVPQQIWMGHRLIDLPDRDDPAAPEDAVDLSHRNLEHVFSLLAAVLPREPLQVALRGLSSPNAGLRGLALEYLESVLAAPILEKLRQLLDTPPQQQRADRTTPERALAELRASTETPVVKRTGDAG